MINSSLINASMYVCMYVCMYVHTYVWIVCMYVCMYLCMYVCMYVCVHVCMNIFKFCVCMYVYMYDCMYVLVCVHVFMNIWIHYGKFVCMYIGKYVCTNHCPQNVWCIWRHFPSLHSVRVQSCLSWPVIGAKQSTVFHTSVPTFNSCTIHVGSTWPYVRVPPIFLGMDILMTSQLTVALIRKLRGSLMCLDYFLTCYLWVFKQPCTGRRPVDWCRD